jgi:antitoxin (DNA-binding transcriptional repressor) of toxin-antitoxin stability system
MSTVTLDEAKQRLGELVQSLPTEREIVITLNDSPVARLTLATSQVKQIPPRFVVASAAELEEKLAEGVRQLDDGAGLSGEMAVQELRERARARRPA